MAPLSSISKEHGLRDAVAENTCPTLSLPGGWSSVCPCVAHLMQTWFSGRCRSKKCQLHLPFHFPVPQICGISLFSYHVTALCHSSPIYKQAGLFKCHCEKDAACSNLHIYSYHHSFLNLARRRFSSSS